MADLDSVGSRTVTAHVPRPAAPPPRPSHGRRRAVLCGGVILAGVILAWSLGLYDYLRLGNLSRLQRWVGGLGPWAPILYMTGYAVLELVLVPALPITILAGIAFGPVWGTLYAWIGATGSEALAFLIARHGARAIVESCVAKSRRLSQIDTAVARHGWRILAFTRLVPVFPFNMQNYAYGLTGIHFSTYLVVSAIFSLPGTVALVIAGDALVEGDADLRWLVVYLGIAALLLGLLSVVPKRLAARIGVTDALSGRKCAHE